MCRCPSFLKFSLGAWEVFWNMPKLSAPCVRAAKNDPPTAPISRTACQRRRAFPKISKLTHARGATPTGHGEKLLCSSRQANFSCGTAQ